MNLLEAELEDVIYNSLVNKDSFLNERGLYTPEYTKVFRQLKLGNYGILDIIGIERLHDHLQITIYELKRECIDINTLLQAARYYKAISNYMRQRNTSFKFHITIVLVGNDISVNNNWVYLFDGILRNVKTYTYSLNQYGLHFKEIKLKNYALGDEGFNILNKA